MRVLHVITGLGNGGAEGALSRLIGNSGDPTQHVVVSLMDAGAQGKSLDALGTKVIALHQRPGCISPGALLNLRRLVREIRPDVVQSWMYHADLAAALATAGLGVPRVWGIRRSAPRRRDLGLATWMVAKVCALLSGFVPAAIISCSQVAIRTHRRFGYADKIVCVPNGFDLPATTGTATEARQQLGLPRGIPVVGHAGRFHPVKGHANFLAAMARVSEHADCIALMAGKGVALSEPAFRQLANRAPGARIHALGDQPDLSTFYRACDLFVLSSHSEGFPNVVAEAMLHGVPCIVTDAGDAALLAGDTAWVVPVDDPVALAQAISLALSVAADRSVWAEWGGHCRERISSTYSVAAMVAGFFKVWERVVEQQQCAA